MRSLTFVLVTLVASICLASQIRVAVIDTGYNGNSLVLCKTGSYDFINNLATAGIDERGHGTDVIKTIEAYSGGRTDYCFLVYKVFGKGVSSATLYARAITEALRQGADVINLSYSGPGYSEEEHEALRRAARLNVRVFAAAGNEGNNLDRSCNAYPACYKVPGIYIVGGVDDNANYRGNYGSVVDEYEPYCRDALFCGTSASTAIATGKYLKDQGY